MDEKIMNRSFYDSVVKVRRGQKSYFATMDKDFLEKELKPMEAEIDRRLASEYPTLEAACKFRRCVEEMRNWQKRYFIEYTDESLKRAKQWERNVDRWIEVTEELIKERQQPKLQFKE
ncbi:MAG: hypothetical protein IJQ60_15080 [Prevotella sp.]|nr:hypothetical protein [Bacteroidaceae bacterium]MBQ6751956.1 hypothetical protein [Bacteroidaceae bacterium]MBR0265191.1 hypothetical protein [Prevotella sp.]